MKKFVTLVMLGVFLLLTAVAAHRPALQSFQEFAFAQHERYVFKFGCVGTEAGGGYPACGGPQGQEPQLSARCKKEGGEWDCWGYPYCGCKMRE